MGFRKLLSNVRVDLGNRSRVLSSQQLHLPFHSQAKGLCVDPTQPTCFLHLLADLMIRLDFCLITVIFFPVAREHPAPFPKVELVKALE